MEEEELGMNLFLGDEFFNEEEDDNITPPDDNINLDIDHDDDEQNDDDVNNDNQNNNEDTDEDTDPDGVVGENTEDDDSDDNNDDSSSPPLYKSLASYLHDEGVLSSVESSELEKIETIQDLAELINKEVKTKELADLSDLQKEAVEAFRAGVDVETFKQQKTVENNLDSITEDILVSDQDLRKELIFQDFINQGFSEQKAQRLTDRSIEADDDIEDAKEALENIKKGVKERYQAEIEFKRKEQEEATKKYQKTQDTIKKNILEKEELVKGIKLNETARKQILSNMLNPVSKNPNTGIDENILMKDQRENEDFNERLYAVYTLSKGFTDFSYFAKKETKNTVKNLEKALKNNQHIINGGSSTFLDDPNSSDYEIGDKIVY